MYIFYFYFYYFFNVDFLSRTIRTILWVDEEISQRGAATYLADHKNDLDNHVIAMESDSGNFE